MSTTKTINPAVKDAILMGWRDKSDREIARDIGMSNRTVSVARKAMEDAGEIIPREVHTVGPCPDTTVYLVPTAIIPAPENDTLYAPIDPNDPSIRALADDIQRNNILEPLVVSADGFILSGHRRRAAALLAGLERVPCRVRRDVRYLDDVPGFVALLASYNRQRVKGTDEQTREEFALATGAGFDGVRKFRETKAGFGHGGNVTLGERRARSSIRDKREFREAIRRVVHAEKPNWPLSDRAIHYRLLNVPGLVRNDKSRTPYTNAPESYKDLTGMLTRMRIDGSLPWAAITDETRPVSSYDIHRSAADFTRRELDGFLTRYWRNLLQSQPVALELLVEKNTVASQLRGVAERYTVPMTSGRGYSSLPPRKEMVERFKASGREVLVVIVVADFDPEGDNIPESFGISLRDDFGIDEDRLRIVKAALTAEQVRAMDLPPGLPSKETSSRHKRFVERHGDTVWELEALPTETLREIVEASIRGQLDIKAFNREVEKERDEKAELAKVRARTINVLSGATGGGQDEV